MGAEAGGEGKLCGILSDLCLKNGKNGLHPQVVFSRSLVMKMFNL